MRKNATVLLASTLILGLGSWAQAQDAAAPDKFPRPEWKVGDWWKVRVLQREVGRERAMRPATPPPEIPGYPPLRDGIPRGWKVSNTFRFKVIGTESVSYPQDQVEGNDSPEEFFKVTVETTEGDKRKAMLLISQADLTVAEVRFGRRRTPLAGSPMVFPEAASLLGVPLDWPDFTALETGKTQVIELPSGSRVRQALDHDADGSWLVTLTELEGTRRSGEKEVYRSVQRWNAGEPWWSFFEGGLYRAELVDKKSK